MKYRFLKHTADIKFQAFGKTEEEMFENASLALKEIMLKKIKIKNHIKKKFEVDGKDKESLLYNFLEEFLFLLDSEDFLLNKIDKIKIKDNKINAEISGDNAENYRFKNDVKAITYNEMFVKKEKGRFICQVVVDV
jgi:SHS2 domain-containing protein